MNVFSKIMKITIGMVLLVGFFFLYKMDGFVDIRWKDSTFSGSLVAFVCLALIANVIFYHFVRLCVRLGKIPFAIQTWWTTKKEVSSRELLEKSFAYLLMDMPERFIRLLQQVPEIPKLHHSKLLLGIYSMQKDQQFPNVSVAQELAKHPNLGFLGYRLWIEALLRSQDKRTAWIILGKAIKEYGDIGWFWAQFALLASDKNLHKEAIEYARKAVKCDSKFGNVLADVYFAFGKLEDQIKNWELAAVSDPSNIQIVVSLAKTYLEQKKTSLAKRLIIKHWDLCASLELGRLFLLTFEDGSSSVIEATKELISENKHTMENQLLLIQACLKANYIQQARDYLTKAISSFGNTKELLTLRVLLTEIDRAEELDGAAWIKQLSQ